MYTEESTQNTAVGQLFEQTIKMIIVLQNTYYSICFNVTGSEDPQVLAVTSAEESKRQSYIHELINTEETYVQDMSIVLEVRNR